MACIWIITRKISLESKVGHNFMLPFTGNICIRKYNLKAVVEIISTVIIQHRKQGKNMKEHPKKTNNEKYKQKGFTSRIPWCFSILNHGLIWDEHSIEERLTMSPWTESQEWWHSNQKLVILALGGVSYPLSRIPLAAFPPQLPKAIHEIEP